jgi:hypothetical protein
MRSVSPSPKGPTDVPKIGEPGTVNVLEIFSDDRLIVAQALKKEVGNFQTHATLSIGLRWSPDLESVA